MEFNSAQRPFVEDLCDSMSRNDCEDCTTVNTSQYICIQQCTATGTHCKRRAIDPDTVPYCMQHISTLAVRPDRWPTTKLHVDALRQAFVYVRDHVIPTSRYTTASKHQRHAMFDKAVDKLTPTVSSRLFGGSEDIVTHTAPFFTFPERIDSWSPTIIDRDSEIVLDKILQHYDADAPTVGHLKESYRWIDDRYPMEEKYYDASKTYFIHCHDIGHTEHIVRKFRLQHIVLIGTFERWVRNGVEDKDDDIFSNFVNLRSVKFLLPWVTQVGNHWMFNCAALVNPSFTGLSSLVDVGKHWMLYCNALVAPAFDGLSRLKDVGDEWMTYCNALVDPSFTGLSSLETVGNNWLSRCQALVSPSFTGLSSLMEIGDSWMANCNALADPNFTGLSSLREIGNRWVYACRALVVPDFAGLSSLVEIGDHWMSMCVALKNPRFTELSSLREIGNYWMYACSVLAVPDFAGLSSLVEIGDHWMYICSALKNPRFTELSSLKHVGPHGHKIVQRYFSTPFPERSPSISTEIDLDKIFHQYASNSTVCSCMRYNKTR